MKTINDNKYLSNANNKDTDLSAKISYAKDSDSVYEIQRSIIFYLRILSLKEVSQLKVRLISSICFS